MDAGKLLTIICVAFFVCVFGGLFGFEAYKDSLNAQVKIACYEAAKTNTNIKCENLK